MRTIKRNVQKNIYNTNVIKTKRKCNGKVINILICLY